MSSVLGKGLRPSPNPSRFRSILLALSHTLTLSARLGAAQGRVKIELKPFDDLGAHFADIGVAQGAPLCTESQVIGHTTLTALDPLALVDIDQG